MDAEMLNEHRIDFADVRSPKDDAELLDDELDVLALELSRALVHDEPLRREMHDVLSRVQGFLREVPR